MLCLPYGEVDCNRKKSITITFAILSGLILFYGLNVLFLENVIRELGAYLMIIKILLLVTIIALSTVVYLVRQHYLLREQLSKQQKVAEEFYIQRDIDMLSGLKNRNAFVRLAQQIEKRGDMVSVMVCDIDGLKFINDTLGHMAGDKIIQKAAEILKLSFPTGTEIFRMGGDEYLAISDGVLSEYQITGIQQNITQLIDQYNEIETAIPLSISFGFACTSSPGLCRFEEVVKQADYAMYQEKRACQDKVYRHLTAALIKK